MKKCSEVAKIAIATAAAGYSRRHHVRPRPIRRRLPHRARGRQIAKARPRGWARAVCDPASVLKGLGEPTRAGLNKLYRSNDLTVPNVVWAPMMTIMPHNHAMWAVIGIYTGREDNNFWRRLPGNPGRVEAAGAKALCERDAEPLGHNIIHSVTNPIPRLTGDTRTAAISSIPAAGANGIRRRCWKVPLIPNGPFAGSKRQMQFLRTGGIPSGISARGTSRGATIEG